jgi:hypothetical protein
MMSIKSVLVAGAAVASLSAGVAFASGPDEFSMQGGSVGTITTYSDSAYTTGTTSYVQPLVDVTTTTYGSGETTLQTETIQYDTMPSETIEYSTVESGTVGEPVTVDINDYLLPEGQ